MNKNDFDFISSKFNEENISAPESLSAENVIDGFDKKDVSKIVKLNKNKRGFKSAIAVVACLAVIITSVSIGVNINKRPVKIDTPVSSGDISGITYFNSYEELSDRLSEVMVKDDIKGGPGVITYFGVREKALYESAETADGLTSNSAESVSDFAKTNVQVESVDEADKVKTDGKYIYYLSDDASCINIYEADGDRAKLVSTIEPRINDDEKYFEEMFIYDGKLVVLGGGTSYLRRRYFQYSSTTAVFTYDLSNIKKPKLVDEYEQSGSYVTSRMIDNTLYVVSNYYKSYYQKQKEIDDYIPCATNAEGNVEKLPVSDICAVEYSKRSSFAVIGAVGVDSGKSNTVKTKAILGAGDNVYCNEKNLYLAASDFDYSDFGGKEETQLIKYSVDKTKIKLTASGRVKGKINDQFSLDEKDGRLRVATTVYNYSNDNKNLNYLFVLDKNLNEIGEVSGFAKSEHIEAVRYVGDTAYVITFETTDPLFVIDLSNPKEPEITGEVKLDGFSSTLTPVDENTLLGIGYTTKENEFGGVQTDGLKIVLFDVKNKNKPKVLSEKELRNCSSPMQEDFKALVRNSKKGYFAIPVNVYTDYESAGTVAVIRIVNGELKLEEHRCSEYDVQRCTYIGDYIYALDEFGEAETLEAFEVK